MFVGLYFSLLRPLRPNHLRSYRIVKLNLINIPWNILAYSSICVNNYEYPKTTCLGLKLCYIKTSIGSTYDSTLCFPSDVLNRKPYRSQSTFQVKSVWEKESKNTYYDETAGQNSSSMVGSPPPSFRFPSDIQEELVNNKLDYMLNQNDKGAVDWCSFKCSILELEGNINKENIDGIIMKKCCEAKSLSLGKSYFKYLKSLQQKINLATYGNYLRLFYDCSIDCNDNDLKEIVEIYEEMQQVYPVFDSNTPEKIILALSITSSWKEYEKLFAIIKKFYNPTTQSYSAVVKAAFKNGEPNLGWALMEEMQFRNLNVPDDVFNYILETSKMSDKNDSLTEMLKFLSKHNMKPSMNLSGILKRTFENFSKNRRGTYTSVLRSGVCRSCQYKLNPAVVNPEDFEDLRTVFLDPVLIGKDIFQKTKPEEFNEFLQFVVKSAPYDVVLDGLNIAFKSHKHKKTARDFAFQLKSVVKHFILMKKKVVVIGRKHMENWPAKDMQYVYDNASVFMADDISQDDPFMLYATLYGGLGTCFVSQDMMRGHKFLLANPKLQTTFQRWQAQHQYFVHYINDNGAVYLRDPIPFMQNIQTNSNGDWHIPYEKKEDLTSKDVVDNFHKHWLCLSSQPPQQNLSGSSMKVNAERRPIKKYRVSF